MQSATLSGPNTRVPTLASVNFTGLVVRGPLAEVSSPLKTLVLWFHLRAALVQSQEGGQKLEFASYLWPNTMQIQVLI